MSIDSIVVSKAYGIKISGLVNSEMPGFALIIEHDKALVIPDDNIHEKMYFCHCKPEFFNSIQLDFMCTAHLTIDIVTKQNYSNPDSRF